MDSKNIIIGILALTTVSFGVYGWTQQSNVREREKKIAELTQRIDTMRRPQQRSSGQRSSGAAWQADPGSRSQGPGAGGARDRSQQQRAFIENRYAPLFKSLNLTPDQLDKFKNLLAERLNARDDVLAVARRRGATDAQIQQLIQEARADVDNSIAALIGSDNYAQFQNYAQTMPHRNVVGRIEQRLGNTPEPLSSAQSEQLVALLAQNTPPRYGTDSGLAFIPITDQVINAAQSFLSPVQVDALRQMQTEQANRQQFQQMRGVGGGGAPGVGGGGGGGKRRGPRNGGGGGGF